MPFSLTGRTGTFPEDHLVSLHRLLEQGVQGDDAGLQWPKAEAADGGTVLTGGRACQQ